MSNPKKTSNVFLSFTGPMHFELLELQNVLVERRGGYLNSAGARIEWKVTAAEELDNLIRDLLRQEQSV